MKRNGGHTITIPNCIDVETLIVNLELDRVGFMKKISPSGLLYCVECRAALGDVISAGCHDVLCNRCAVETRSTGNRQDVPMVFIEQAVCAECAVKGALVRCQDCVDCFCYDCFKQTHARGKRQRHCVGLPQRTFCFECDGREASYICVECEDALCSRCSAQIQRSYSFSPWHIFYNNALAPSWYNFQKRYLVTADPNNLADPPEEEEEGGEDGKIPASAD